MADPFDTAGADVPGTGQANLGAMMQSPSFWNNLASFGAALSTAANARTPQGFLAYGNGFAGPLGAATQDTMAQAQHNALVRSELAGQAASTQGQQLQNERIGLEMPYMRALAHMQEGMVNQMGGGGLPLASGTPQNDYSFINGSPQATGPETADTGNQPSVISNQPLIVDPKKRPALLQTAVAGTPVPPEVLDGVVSEESGWNANARNAKSGAYGLGGVLPSTAAAPGFGMAPVKMTDLANPANALKFTAQYLYNRGKTMGMTDQDWSDPAKIAAVLAAYHGPATDANGVNGQAYSAAIGERLKAGPSWEVAQNGGTAMPAADAENTPTPQTTGTPQMSGMPTPQQAYQLANQYRQQALMMRMAGFDGSAYEQAANQYMSYALAGPTAAAQGWAKAGPELYVQQNQPRSLRGPGSALVIPGHPEQTIQVPMEVHGVDQNGKPYTYFVNPLDKGAPQAPVAGSPPSAPPGTVMSVPSGLPPGQEELIKGASEEYHDEGKKTYLSAVNTLGWAENMLHSINTLGDNGMLAMGTDANARAEFVKHINTLSSVLGIQPPYDPNKVANWESFNKYTKLAGMQVVNQFFGGSREAASIINSATSAVPNAENTPTGAKLVLSGIRESARQIIDRRTFETNWANTHEGNLIGADVAFNKERPAQMYTRRAISQVEPYSVKTPADASRFLPGTLVRTPDGRVLQVPGSPDLALAK